MYFLTSIASFVAAIILMFKGRADRAIMLLIVSALFAMASSFTLLGSEINSIKDLIKDKVLAEKTMAAIYKIAKEKEGDDCK